MITWPAALPDCPIADGYTENPQDNRLRTDMSAGPVKMRPTSTVIVIDMSVSYLLSPDEVLILDNFYKEDCNFGTEKFQWIHPRTREVVTARFASPPSYSYNDGQYAVSWDMEVLP